jgi:hypothetical protein
MTTALFRFFCFISIFIAIPSGVMAVEDRSPIQVFVGGRSFNSFKAYTDSKAPPVEAIEAPVLVLQNAVKSPDSSSDGVPVNNVAGVRPSLAQVLKEFKSSGLAGRPVCPREALVTAIQSAAEGKEGPLLLVADGDKVRIMELKSDTTPGTNP